MTALLVVLGVTGRGIKHGLGMRLGVPGLSLTDEETGSSWGFARVIATSSPSMSFSSIELDAPTWRMGVLDRTFEEEVDMSISGLDSTQLEMAPATLATASRFIWLGVFGRASLYSSF